MGAATPQTVLIQPVVCRESLAFTLGQCVLRWPNCSYKKGSFKHHLHTQIMFAFQIIGSETKCT